MSRFKFSLSLRRILDNTLRLKCRAILELGGGGMENERFSLIVTNCGKKFDYYVKKKKKLNLKKRKAISKIEI